MHRRLCARTLLCLLAVFLAAGACSSPSYEASMEEGKAFLGREGDEAVSAAIDCFSNAVKKRPDSYEAFYYRGLAEARRFDCDKALPDFSRAIELSPGFADAYYRRALCFILVDQTGSERAVSDLNTALALDPNHRGASWHLNLIAHQGRNN